MDRTLFSTLCAVLATMIAGNAFADGVGSKGRHVVTLGDRLSAPKAAPDPATAGSTQGKRLTLEQLGIGMPAPVINGRYDRRRPILALQEPPAFRAPSQPLMLELERMMKNPLEVGPLSVHPESVSFMFSKDQSNPLTARWENRQFDLEVPIGIDLRFWKGSRLTFQLTWFLPSPLLSGGSTADPNSVHSHGMIDGSQACPEQSGVAERCHSFEGFVRRAYKAVWNQPRAQLILKVPF